ncbi:MAG TPA: phosphoribosylamine--glycine ligase [Caldisericia bacterium]|nr:phosphoribosylamine--glycine ligase [Caldisericia bacterium]HPL90003.1 phosphoribosylamine--glycine ligase [Caldisericia bacterium]HQG59483.1 phosphoribosylamine--glycine ligase [Caldisericia bacterium]HQH48948.1 phosphoribosylamine--glycine ligase [Caldisericia bacterium]HQJ44562.1 phosphoribosylamine--glycine ligase [Caldisericia bacterium]
MNYLVLGNGAREHAICWALSKNSDVHAMPGNPGMILDADIVSGNPMNFGEVASVAKKLSCSAVFAGAELPLVEGITDALASEGIFVFGPSKEGAMLEGSKAFAKDFMKRNGIPCADHQTFDNEKEAMDFVSKHPFPLVIKVDGLASGKGVHIVEDLREAEIAIKAILSEKTYGESGRVIVIEEFLVGKELTVMAFTDGKVIKMLPPSRDHKRLEDGDKGPMTGGMGSYCPVPDADPGLLEKIKTDIVEKTLVGLQKESIDYKGVIYCGLMLTGEGPKVLEYNCRFGDPEAQVVLPMLQTPLSAVVEAVKEGELERLPIVAKKGFAACVVLASEGYPGKPVVGLPVGGFNKAQTIENVLVFAAGIGGEPGKLVTSGGRVVSCVGLGSTLRMALGRAYSLAGIVDFKGKQFRGDIGGRYARGRTSIVDLRLKIRPRGSI